MVRVSTGKGSSQEYGTPDYIFNYFHDQFTYTMDGAASHENKKLPTYCSKEYSFIDHKVDYFEDHRIWINPPYNNVLPFVQKALLLMDEGIKLISFFVNDDPTTKWYRLLWYDHCYTKYFDRIGHRVKFIGANNSQSYPSVCITLTQKKEKLFDRYFQIVDPFRPNIRGSKKKQLIVDNK